MLVQRGMFPLGIVHSKRELWLVSKEQQGEEKQQKRSEISGK